MVHSVQSSLKMHYGLGAKLGENSTIRWGSQILKEMYTGRGNRHRQYDQLFLGEKWEYNVNEAVMGMANLTPWWSGKAPPVDIWRRKVCTCICVHACICVYVGAHAYVCTCFHACICALLCPCVWVAINRVPWEKDGENGNYSQHSSPEIIHCI